MNEASIHSVNAYWSAMFGCTIADLRPPNESVACSEGAVPLQNTPRINDHSLRSLTAALLKSEATVAP